jgi:hypothetical protein
LVQSAIAVRCACLVTVVRCCGVGGRVSAARARGAAGAGISEVTYQPVTFGEGFVFAARFARDGRTVVYSADWENQKKDIFVTSLDSPGARALGYENADLLSVSPDGALAILVEGIVPGGNPYARRGTIARASLTGGAPARNSIASRSPILRRMDRWPCRDSCPMCWRRRSNGRKGKPIFDAQAQQAFEGNLANPGCRLRDTRCCFRVRPRRLHGQNR